VGGVLWGARVGADRVASDGGGLVVVG